MQDCTVLVSRFGCIAPQNLKQVSLFGLEHLDVENCGAHVIVLAAYPLPVVCFGGRTYLYWNSTNAVVFRVFTCFVDCSFQDEVVLSVIIAKAARIPAFDVVCWVSRFCADKREPPEQPRPFASTFIFTAKKPFENVCTTTCLPGCGSVSSYLFAFIASAKYCCCRCPGNCSVSSRAVGWSGVAAQEKKEIVIVLLELKKK